MTGHADAGGRREQRHARFVPERHSAPTNQSTRKDSSQPAPNGCCSSGERRKGVRRKTGRRAKAPFERLWCSDVAAHDEMVREWIQGGADIHGCVKLQDESGARRCGVAV